MEYSLAEIDRAAQKVVEETPSKILLFQGPMGAGKTTLIKAICRRLGVEELTSSPTFSLVNEYHAADGLVIYHFDFYRIEQEEEAYDMGVEEYLESGAWCLVEWPEKVQNLLPLEATFVEIEVLEDGRRKIQLNQNA